MVALYHLFHAVKTVVTYEGGQSRYGEYAVDYMLAVDGDVELYAEAVPVDGDETGTHDDLAVEIMRQAVAEGIDLTQLEWPYDAPLVTTAQAADILDLSVQRIQRLCADGRMGRKVGRDWVISVEDLAAEQVRPPAGRPRRQYWVRYHTGAGDESADSLDEAMDLAVAGVAYTQQDITIEDEDGKLLARLPWCGVAATEDDEVVADYGKFGFYGEWWIED